MRSFDLYRKHLENHLTAAVQNAADHAVKTAKGLTPYGDGRDGGHLRDCIFTRSQVKNGCFYGDVIAQNPHALYVELGTCRMAAHPYLRPALKGHASTFLYALSK